MRPLVFALAAAALSLIPTAAAAQCAFDRPSGSTSYTGDVRATLVRAFVSCAVPGGNTPTDTALGGNVPACKPVENFNEQGGSPANGWQFTPGTSYGRVQIKRTSGGENIPSYPPTSRDALITLKLYHIRRAGGGFATGGGTLRILFRATIDDYDAGDATIVDFPLSMPFTLSGGTGSISVSRKLGDLMWDLYGSTVTRLPDCTSVEILNIDVTDPNGTIFATAGINF